MSSLKIRTLSRYSFSIRRAFEGPKSSKCKSAFGNNRVAVWMYAPISWS